MRAAAALPLNILVAAALVGCSSGFMPLPMKSSLYRASLSPLQLQRSERPVLSSRRQKRVVAGASARGYAPPVMMVAMPNPLRVIGRFMVLIKKVVFFLPALLIKLVTSKKTDAATDGATDDAVTVPEATTAPAVVETSTADKKATLSTIKSKQKTAELMVERQNNEVSKENEPTAAVVPKTPRIDVTKVAAAKKAAEKGTAETAAPAVVKPPVPRIDAAKVAAAKKAGEKVVVEEAAPVASDLAEAAKEAEFKVEEKAEKTEKVAAEKKTTPKEKRGNAKEEKTPVVAATTKSSPTSTPASTSTKKRGFDSKAFRASIKEKLDKTRIKVNGSVLTTAVASSGATESMQLENAGLDLGEQQMVLALSVLATVIAAAPQQL